MYPSSNKITFFPDFESRYAVDKPAIPPPTMTTSSDSDEEIFLFNLSNFIGCGISSYQEGSLLPDVFNQMD